jgi:protein tyrosine phosphatase (PTP) superfamily phosphohydrolase (DUF442 family)
MRLFRRLGLTVLALTLLPLLASCASPKQAEHRAIVTERLEPYECGTITRLHTYGGIFLASQPQPEDFEHAKKGGIKTVINLRLPSEVTEFDEKEIVEGLGMAYYNPGFEGPDMLTDDIFDRVRSLLSNEDHKPILLHCNSANRVGAVWLAYRVLDGGLGYEDALVEAKTVGLKTPAYEQKAREYIERHKQD